MTQRMKELEIQADPISPVWETTVATCFAKNPADCPQDVSEVMRLLERTEVIEPTAPASQTGPDELEGRRLRSRLRNGNHSKWRPPHRWTCRQQCPRVQVEHLQSSRAFWWCWPWSVCRRCSGLCMTRTRRPRHRQAMPLQWPFAGFRGQEFQRGRPCERQHSLPGRATGWKDFDWRHVLQSG